MAFSLWGGSNEHSTVQVNNQTTNVAVDVNPSFNFGPQFLQPLANSLMQINEGLNQRYEPLAAGIQSSIENANRLAGDLRRTANFSMNPAVGADAAGPPYLLIGAALVVGLFLAKA